MRAAEKEIALKIYGTARVVTFPTAQCGQPPCSFVPRNVEKAPTSAGHVGFKKAIQNLHLMLEKARSVPAPIRAEFSWSIAAVVRNRVCN